MAIIVPIIGMNYGAFIATVQPDKIAKIGGESLIVSSSFSLMVLAGTILIFLSLYIVLFSKRLFSLCAGALSFFQILPILP